MEALYFDWARHIKHKESSTKEQIAADFFSCVSPSMWSVSAGSLLGSHCPPLLLRTPSQVRELNESGGIPWHCRYKECHCGGRHNETWMDLYRASVIYSAQ